MRTKLTLLKTVCGIGLITSIPACGVPLSGEIHFVGGGALNDTFLSATEFTSLNLTVLGGAQSGDYAGVPGGTPGGWAGFVFDPAPAGTVPLWSFTLGPVSYSFEATSIAIVDRGLNHLDIGGTGIARITGLDAAYGEWSVGVTGAQTTFGFVASAKAEGEPVPDIGTTSSLLAITVVGLALIRNKTQRLKENLS